MTDRLKDIIAYDKQKNPIKLVDALLEKDKGIPGDRHFDDDKDQITILLKSSGDDNDDDDLDNGGLCLKRFKANLTIDTSNMEDKASTKEVGDVFEIGNATLKITRKKTCHKECTRYTAGDSCGLKNCAYFATVLKPGKITQNDIVG